MEYNSLVTGEICTLYKLFSKDNVIIIPDLQRDYCWGTKTIDKDLVRDFVRNIKDNSKADLSLGLIYGYEAPIGHIQLCDGQQRITTLFLLLGLINKRTDNKFQNQLISIFELEQDDKDPYLQYSIRESSLYFLSDLVCHFFIPKNDLQVSEIRSQPWYFKDYDLDPSIQSMLEALATIEEELAGSDLFKLGDIIVNHLSFIYYDMGDRASGEETFVVINTTGEPLTATENLKPLYIDAQHLEDRKTCSEKWEEWETWFWKNRKGSGDKKNDTADNGFREFLRWVTLVNTKDSVSFKKIQETGNLDYDLLFESSDIDAYFKVIQFLFNDAQFFGQNLDWLSPDDSNKNDKDVKNINNQIVWFRVLPVIEYCKRFGLSNERNIIRIKQFYENLSRVDNISKNIANALPAAVKLAKIMKSEDIAELINLDHSSLLLTEEERLKFKIYSNFPESRLEIEELFWAAENHPIWKGEIIALIKWSLSSGNFILSSFKRYVDIFNYVFTDNAEKTKLDLTRRALLTRELDRYPRIFNGYTNTSFCSDPSDWHTLIYDNEIKVKLFLDELLEIYNIELELQNMINSNNSGKDFDEFVKVPELLKYCRNKNIQFRNNGWLLLQGKNLNGEYANLKFYKLFLQYKSEPFWDVNRWKINFYGKEGNCIYFDSIADNIALDFKYFDDFKYSIEVFQRNLEGHIIKENLDSFALDLQLQWDTNRYVTQNKSLGEAIDIISKIHSYKF